MGPAQIVDQAADLDDLRRVQAHRGFVQNDDLRLPQQRGGDAHPLAVTLGQVADEPVLHGLQPGAAHGSLRHGCAVLFVFHAFQLRHKQQVFPHCHFRIQRGLLRKIPDGPFGLQRFLRNVMPRHFHGACRGGQVPGQDIHGGGFARAVGAEQAVDTAVLHGKADVVHRCVGAVSLCQMLHFDQSPALLFSQICFLL